MMVALVGPVAIRGITDESATRNPSIPRTRKFRIDDGHFVHGNLAATPLSEELAGLKTRRRERVTQWEALLHQPEEMTDSKGSSTSHRVNACSSREQIRKETTKPVLRPNTVPPSPITPIGKTYSYPRSLKGPGTCKPTTPDGPVNRNALQLPKSGNPGMVAWSTS
jgi:hypothetical protein